MGTCGSVQNGKVHQDSDVEDEPVKRAPVKNLEPARKTLAEWKNVESGIGPRAFGLKPRKDRILHAKSDDDETDLMSYDDTEMEEKRKNRFPDPTGLRGMTDSKDGFDDESDDESTEEVGEVLFSGPCIVENYLDYWKVEIQRYKGNNLRMHLTHPTVKHKVFGERILLAGVVECTIDQTKITIRFPKQRLVLFFDQIEESRTFIRQFPSHLTCRLLFSEVAIYCKRQKKALVQLVTYGRQKRFIGRRHGAALLIKTEKEEVVHPIHSSTECSSQVRLVAVDEHSQDPRLLQFVTVGMAQTFIRKFSEIIHDLYAVTHILLYSGIVIHNKKVKRIELRQFDNGHTFLKIFLRKEPTITFTSLPTYTRNGKLELILVDDQGTEIHLHFRTEGEIDVFSQYLSPGLE